LPQKKKISNISFLSPFPDLRIVKFEILSSRWVFENRLMIILNEGVEDREKMPIWGV